MPIYTILLRRGTAAEWTSANPTLQSGELGFESDTARLKIGNGSTAWTSLNYIAYPNQVVSSGGLNNLTTNQQATIVLGTVVTTTDGKRWIYSGAGSKTSSASYVELADITPDWSVIASKPSTFPPTLPSASAGQVLGYNGSVWLAVNQMAGGIFDGGDAFSSNNTFDGGTAFGV